MIRRIGGIIGLVLMMGACSEPRATEALASATEKREAWEAYAECVFKRTVELDDGRSDARTIAMAVRPACHSSYMRTVKLATQGRSLDFTRGYIDGALQTELDIATQAVLRVRAGSIPRSLQR